MIRRTCGQGQFSSQKGPKRIIYSLKELGGQTRIKNIIDIHNAAALILKAG